MEETGLDHIKELSKSFKSGGDMIQFNFTKTEVVLQIDEKEEALNRESSSQSGTAQSRQR